MGGPGSPVCQIGCPVEGLRSWTEPEYKVPSIVVGAPPASMRFEPSQIAAASHSSPPPSDIW